MKPIIVCLALCVPLVSAEQTHCAAAGQPRVPWKAGTATVAITPDGPVDHSIPVLQVTGSDDQLKAVLFGYACHSTTLSFYKFCGDYSGFAQRYLEQAHPGMTALFIAGCGGDQNPYPRGTLQLCQQHGQALANGVEAALQTSARPVRGSLRTVMDDVVLEFAEPPSRIQLEDVFGYLPSLRVLEEGGGAMRYTSLPGRFAPSVEKLVLAKLRELAIRVGLLRSQLSPNL